jgi:hypothetical protein
MQVLIHVISKNSDSLRKKIANDKKLGEFKLQIAKQKQMGRSPGWLTIHSTYAYGAIKVEWIDSSRTLLCRAVTQSFTPRGLSWGGNCSSRRGRFEQHLGA